jgi:hypothetical protein
MPMAVADLLPSRYYVLVGAIAVTVLASMAALFDSRWLFLAGAAGILSLVGVRFGSPASSCSPLEGVVGAPTPANPKGPGFILGELHCQLIPATRRKLVQRA